MAPGTNPRPKMSALPRLPRPEVEPAEQYGHDTNGVAEPSPVASLVLVRAPEGANGAPLDRRATSVVACMHLSRFPNEDDLVLLIKKYVSGVISTCTSG
jgi:hypothetical protein